MKRALRDAWVADLRSGKHRQTTGCLHRYKEGYCCLGRLCEVAGIKPVRFARNGWRYDGRSSVLPDSLAPELDSKPGQPNQGHLIKMNDKQGKTFAEIADWVEAYVPVEDSDDTRPSA